MFWSALLSRFTQLFLKCLQFQGRELSTKGQTATKALRLTGKLDASVTSVTCIPPFSMAFLRVAVGAGAYPSYLRPKAGSALYESPASLMTQSLIYILQGFKRCEFFLAFLIVAFSASASLAGLASRQFVDLICALDIFIFLVFFFSLLIF